MDSNMKQYDSSDEEIIDDDPKKGEHFANWNSIISTVKDNLPTLDTDSEISSMTEDSDTETFIFQRDICTTLDNSSGTESIPSKISPHLDGYQETRFSKDSSTSLLFQRLDCKAPKRHYNDGMHIVDLELPIYDGDTDGAYKFSIPTDKELQNKLTPVEDRNNSVSRPFSVAGLLEMCKESDEASSSEEMISVDVPSSPVLSFKILEKYNLDGVLDKFQSTVTSDDKVTSQGKISSAETSTDCVDNPDYLMDELVNLSVLQSGSFAKLQSENNESHSKEANIKATSGSGQFQEKLGQNHGEHSDKKAVATSSCGVSANLPQDFPELSWSEPTTIFIDLRKNNENEKEASSTSNTFAHKDHLSNVKATSSPSSSNEKTSSKNLMTEKDQTGMSDDDSDEDDFERWKMHRKKFKNFSATLHDTDSKPSNNPSQIKQKSVSDVKMEACENQSTGFSPTLSHRLKDCEEILNSSSLDDEKTKHMLKELTIRKVQSLKNKRKEINMLNGHANSIQQAAEETLSTSGDASAGIYARQRLKKPITIVENNDISIPNSVVKSPQYGKSTVLFAEEPKTDVSDTTNIYRDKKITSVTDTINVPSAITMSVQTNDSFSTKYSTRDYAKDFSCSKSDLQAAVHNRCTQLVEERKPKHCVHNDSSIQRKVSNNRDTFSIVQNQRKQPPLSVSSSLCTNAIHDMPVPTIPWEARENIHAQLESAFKEHFTNFEANMFPLLYEREVTFDQELRTVPKIIDTQSLEKMVLLSFQMSSPGCIVLNRSSGGHRFVPLDQPDGLSITYSLLLSWLLALIPDNINKPFDPPSEDVFTIDSDTDQESDSAMKDGGKGEVNLVEIPFNVVSLHQVWQEETQTIVTNAVVIPNFFYKPDVIKRRERRKKIYKKESAFLQVVWHFLQSNRIQEVCPWYARPESPILYSLHETQFTCATKPLSTFITASNNSQLIQKALKRNPGFCWKLIKSDDFSTSSTAQCNNQLQSTICLLQRETFTYPVCIMDLVIRLQQYCLDLVSLRLVYVTRKFVQKNILSHTRTYDLEEMVPCVAIAIRGKQAIQKMQNIIGPRDPVLARMTDQGSLNAIYGEQLSKRRGDKDVPTEMNIFHCPRGAERVQQQLVVWFSGRYQHDDALAVYEGKQIISIGNKFQKSATSGKANGKNKNRNKNSAPFPNFNQRIALEENACSKLNLNHYLVTCYPSQICLVISPRFPPQYLGDIIAIVSDQGFSLDGLKRMVLNDKKAAALCVRSRYLVYFKPPPMLDMTLDGEYYEIDSWWLRPVTIMLLSRENAFAHYAGLISCLQSELIYQMIQPSDESQLRDLTYQCFHICQYTDSISHTLGAMIKMPEIELHSGISPRSFHSDPEMEQIVVLSLLGYEIINESGCILRTLFHGEFSLETDVISQNGIENDHSEFRGFELLGIKYIPLLTAQLAKELTPFEVGTRLWYDSISVIKDTPALICALRRVNAYKVMQSVLNIASNNNKGKTLLVLSEMDRLMSTTPEITYRQVKTFFSEKELFADNRCRPLLKYLPPPNRVAQYLNDNNEAEEGYGDSLLANNQDTSKLSKKKKKNQSKEKSNQQTQLQSHESILNCMLSWPQPLTSILIIKPDAFPRHCVKILRRLYQEHFLVVAARMTVMCEDQAMQILPSRFRKMPGESRIFVSHMTSAASLVLCVQRCNAVRKLLDVAGPANPWNAKALERNLSKSQGNWRAEFGIDEFSNAIHVSESYVSACEEQKLFFPEGLCCHETIELKMEQVPTPAEDKVMCTDKMKGREIKVGADFDIDACGSTGMEIQPVCVVLSSPLVHPQVQYMGKNVNKCNNVKRSKTTPPFVDIVEQFITQGYQICALRMCWFNREQAGKALELFEERNVHEKAGMVDRLIHGPSLVILLQRENGLLLFDSILGSCLKHQCYLHHIHHFLRTQTTSQTHNVAKYLFHRVEHHNSVIHIVHKRALEWLEHNT